MNELRILIFFLVLCFVHTTAGSGFCAVPGPPAGDVLALAKNNKDATYKQALAGGARVEETGDGTSFVVWWNPPGFDPRTGITFVSLHGHAGWATRDFVVWQKILRERGYAFLGIQWWYGRSMESIGYAKPRMIYGWVEEALKRHGVAKGRVIFAGFSMGSANSYGVSLFDRLSGASYFAVNIANAGAMESDFPLYRRMFNGEFGEKPLQDMRWLLYCSLHDQEHAHACEEMAQTKEWLTGFGASVDWFYQDPVGNHGGFMAPKVHNEALDLAEKILKSKS